jgi:hypothetical protein
MLMKLIKFGVRSVEELGMDLVEGGLKILGGFLQIYQVTRNRSIDY